MYRLVLVVSFFILLSFAFLPSLGSAQIFGPSSYEDCVIENMQGVTSDTAAEAVLFACASKHINSRRSATENIGWNVENNGTGRCHLLWDGASFRETKLRKAPEAYNHYEVELPRQFKVSLYIPKAISIMQDQLDEQAELRQIVRMFGTWPSTFCGKPAN